MYTISDITNEYKNKAQVIVLSKDENFYLDILNILNKGLSFLIIVLYFIQHYIYNQESNFILYYVIILIILSVLVIFYNLYSALKLKKSLE